MTAYTFRRYRLLGDIESVTSDADFLRVEADGAGYVRVWTDPADAVVHGVDYAGTRSVTFPTGLAPDGVV